MDAIRLVDKRVLGEEAVTSESKQTLLPSDAVDVVYHTAFTFETASIDVQETNRVTNSKAFVGNRGVHLLDVSSALVAQGYCEV